MESDDIIDADDVDVEPEDTGNVHSDEELDAGSDHECPYQYNRWNENDEEDDGYENILSPQSARGAVELDEVEDYAHGDDEESDRGSPGDARDPQPNEAGREQGERGEQDGGVDCDADDNTATVEHPRYHHKRKNDYSIPTHVLARLVLTSNNWNDERKTWFKDEFFKAVYPAHHWKGIAKVLRSEVLRNADDGDGGMARGDMMAWSQVPGEMAVTLGLVARKIPTARASRRIGGATGVPRDATESNYADWKA